jgi:inorganic phosphate transporter, PiT family
MVLIFLSAGLFLGWSLGANDAANVFGSAVGTRMVRFKTAAMVCGIFVIIGAVAGGAGTSHTLGMLGSVNAIAGAFIVALSAGFTVFWMTRARIPVSTSQAIVGAIIGWNIFTGGPTNMGALEKIVLTWILCPVLAAVIAIILYLVFKTLFNQLQMHLLRRDTYLRIALIVVGAFGAYSLGSNNIANVMGVFVPVKPFDDLMLFGGLNLSGTQLLFLLGGISIAIGVYTYSRKVMETVGGSLLKLSPEAALVIVLAQALVLFFFASQDLEHWLLSHGLPAFPLVPVSSSQAIVGAILGVGLLRSWRSIKIKAFAHIASGWLVTPVAACLITFISLFFMQNVFGHTVSKKTVFLIRSDVISYLNAQGVYDEGLQRLINTEFLNGTQFLANLKTKTGLSESEITKVYESAKKDSMFINSSVLKREIDPNWFTEEQIKTLSLIENQKFSYSWQLFETLEKLSHEWKYKPEIQTNKMYNKDLKMKREYIVRQFRIQN